MTDFGRLSLLIVQGIVLRLCWQGWPKPGEWKWIAKKLIRKAFDSFSPLLLINILQAYKLYDETTQPIISYFRGREKRMRVNTVTTDWVVAKKRCPQGSMFGPLIRTIMPDVIWDAYVSMYANDHQVFVAKGTTKSVETIPVENGERMTKWYQENLLKGNCDKYQTNEIQKEKGKLIRIYVVQKWNRHNPLKT